MVSLSNPERDRLFHQPARRMNEYLVRWAKRKYQQLYGNTRRAKRWLVRVARREPKLFAQWRLGVRPDGWTMGAV
jgi:RNA-directed DNA polymerase